MPPCPDVCFDWVSPEPTETLEVTTLEDDVCRSLGSSSDGCPLGATCAPIVERWLAPTLRVSKPQCVVEEASLAFDSPGVVAMAATKGQDANGCQFFVSLGEAPWLDGKHVAFGRVSSGLEVLRAIEERGSAHGRTRGVVVVSNCGQLQ